jgi:CRP/FNR family transcriptional activator FtrB
MRSVTRPQAGPLETAGSELVRASPMLAALSPKVLDALLAVTTIEHVPTRTLLLREGEPARSLFLVLEGLVQLFTTADARQITLTILRAPALLPVESVCRDGPLLASARTLQRAHVGRIDIEEARRLFAQEREFADLVNQHLAAHWDGMLREVKSLRARTSFQRLVGWILAMHRQVSGPIELPYDKAVLAARLAMAPETLSRDLARLGGLGVTVRGRKLDVADIRLLEELAGASGPDLPPTP